MPTNKYPGDCYRCGTHHLAGAANLILTDRGWRVECFTPCEKKPEAKRETVSVGDLNGILSLFDKAREHLKFPAIVLGVPAISAEAAIRINVSGERAAVPGSLTVLDANRDEASGRREWLGRIHRDGRYEPTRKSTTLDTSKVTERLREFALDPARIAAEHGKLTGRCCFCNTALTDERSTSVGYGPICAEHFGLAWGERPAEFAARPTPKHIKPRLEPNYFRPPQNARTA